MKSLGRTLKDAREQASFTLKQVEEATGISNAYLSQVENEKIKKPSANVLHKLATAYNIELEVLLGAAGIIEESNTPKTKMLNSIALSSQQLSSEEEDALMKYLKFLRHEKRNG
ncbi:helix-turn-helix domain-containing protein [Pedobacter cryophilus]|uniref:Helix-turn-helix transcriptional regulator n=1 Tax=Pedobacter cryophilus TaxID=2571271 RepID=A0A4U1BWQ3_9SPHI|nr:helix-turn-helix domain-containing protein [Pedobacter cryophilus]TKB95753.1 helix-turn-helix transcriptional regulator [Pedobacter cryophilus]